MLSVRRSIAVVLASLVALCTMARADDAGAIPPWSTFGGGPSAYAFALDPAEVRGGVPALRIRAVSPAPQEFGASVWTVDATPYRGKRVRLTGEVKCAAAGSASLWLRVDGSPIGGFDNMTAEIGRGDRALHGDRDWTPLAIDMDVPGDSAALVFGDLILGGGTMWSTYPHLQVLGDAQSAAARDAKPPRSLDAAQRAAVEAALRRDAVTLHTVDPNAPLDDLAAFDRDVANARIVGLGEASHGTAEFFRMKHRLFRDLVERHGVTVFAFEANLPEAHEMDRYVTTGEGDPEHALHSLRFWTWQTAEVLALATWMRAYNAAPGNHPTLHFAGFDAQFASTAVDEVERFATARSAAVGDAVRARYACLHVTDEVLVAMTADAKRACSSSIAAVAALIAPLSPDADAARAARIVEQVAASTMNADPASRGFVDRDAAMAENVAWLAETRYPHAKLALWAHNGHIGAQTSDSYVTMGEHLRRHFGPAYVRIGFAFDRGTITAVGGGSLGTQPVAAAPPGTLESVLNDVGPSLYLSLHTLRAGDPLTAWLDGGTRSREPGALYGGGDPSAWFATSKERERFDALIFIAESHASALLPGARRR
jgi:erythromycin esterase